MKRLVEPLRDFLSVFFFASLGECLPDFCIGACSGDVVVLVRFSYLPNVSEIGILNDSGSHLLRAYRQGLLGLVYVWHAN